MSTRAAVLALPLLASGCIGWASASLPPALTENERAIVVDARLPLTVGVERVRRAPVGSDRLLDALRATALFDHVAPLSEFSTPPDLVARVDDRLAPSNSGMIPLWTIVTLGIVPSSKDESWGWGFTLGPPDRNDPVAIAYVHTGRTTLGWVALVDGLLPDRTGFPFSPRGSSRMTDRLKLAILARRDELLRLASGAMR
jgi:hypothetical protein